MIHAKDTLLAQSLYFGSYPCRGDLLKLDEAEFAHVD